MNEDEKKLILEKFDRFLDEVEKMAKKEGITLPKVIVNLETNECHNFYFSISEKSEMDIGFSPTRKYKCQCEDHKTEPVNEI